MRILYVAMADEYGRPELGPSFEEMNFRGALEPMVDELVAYDLKRRDAEIGREGMNAELVETAATLKPDLVFFFLFENEIQPDTIEAVASAGKAATMNWFADDHWRFESFSRHYAPSLDWVVTTDHDAPARYEALGHKGVILSQWACNHHIYKPTTDAQPRSVTFVEQPHGDRRMTIERLKSAGIDVECWGDGWPAGRIDHDQMLSVFSSSRINLNLSNSSSPQRSIRARLGALVRRIPYDASPRPSQIKGRTFEVPGCGGFLLTDRVPHLERYFEPGREIGLYEDTADLAEQVIYWLENDERRAAVAEAGYRRVLSEHTYDHRFSEIFARAGLA